MRAWIELLEDESQPSELLLSWAKAHKPDGINFQACDLGCDGIGIQWIERTSAPAGTPLMFLQALCDEADRLDCHIDLGVQIEDEDDEDARYHGDLVRYYEQLGFQTKVDWDDEFVNMERMPSSLRD